MTISHHSNLRVFAAMSLALTLTHAKLSPASAQELANPLAPVPLSTLIQRAGDALTPSAIQACEVNFDETFRPVEDRFAPSGSTTFAQADHVVCARFAPQAHPKFTEFRAISSQEPLLVSKDDNGNINFQMPGYTVGYAHGKVFPFEMHDGNLHEALSPTDRQKLIKIGSVLATAEVYTPN